MLLAAENKNTFAEVLADAAENFGGRPFIIEGERQYSFAEFNGLVDRAAGLLREHGVAQGATVTLAVKNSAAYLLCYFAAGRLGAVVNPLPVHLGAEETADKAKFAEAALVVADESRAAALAAAGCRVLTAGDEFMRRVMAAPPLSDPRHVAGDSIGYLYYSSGTTGLPKLIQYTHRSELVMAAAQLRTNFSRGLGPHLCFLPLAHTAAIRYTLFPCLLSGNPVILAESFWKVRDRLWELVAEHGVTFMETVPSILIAILHTKYPGFRVEQARTLRLIGCGSAFLPVSVQREFTDRYGVPVANLYGLSETGPTHFDDPFAADWQPGGIGRPFDVVTVRVLDEQRREVPAGTVGEFAIGGPGLLMGYHRNPELYAASVCEGFFLTGDLGSMAADGCCYYTDRKKDLIIKGGVNIVPAQIDEVLVAHPDVQEAATIGVPDLLLGENIKAYVVAREGHTPDLRTLRQYCREKLGDFKTPTAFSVVAELPKGPSGKILKRELREREYRAALAAGKRD